MIGSFFLAGNVSAALIFSPESPQPNDTYISVSNGGNEAGKSVFVWASDGITRCDCELLNDTKNGAWNFAPCHDDNFTFVEWTSNGGKNCSSFATLADLRLDAGYVSESNYTIGTIGEDEEATTTAFVVDGAVFGAAVGAAMQMLMDNIDLMFYVFGIPLFLIVVAIILDWIKKIKSEKKTDVDYIRDAKGRIIGGRNEKRQANDRRYQDTIYWASGGKRGRKM